MKKLFRSELLNSIILYFLLALAIIIAYKAVIEINIIGNFVRRAWSIITPFFYGLILAYILNIPCGGIIKILSRTKSRFFNKSKKIISIVLVYVIFALLVYLALNLILPAIFNSVSIFTANLPSIYASVLQFVGYVNDLDLPGITINADEVMSVVQGFVQNFDAERIASSFNALLGVSSAVFNGFLAFISSFYILVEKEKITMFIGRLLRVFASIGVYNAVTEYTEKLNCNFKQYIKTQTIDGCILGTIVTVELAVLGSPYFLLLGIILAVLNYIPYFGSIFGSIFAILVVAFTQGFTIAAFTALILLITQQIDGNIIQPRLMGKSFSLSPLLIIISVTIGGAIAGVLGMLVVIPIVAVLKDILDGIITHHERRKFMIPDENTTVND